MSPDIKYLKGIVIELCKLSNETPWVEFKHNNADPEEIGEYISALSNSAALLGKTHAYLVWGIEDQTHDIIGTSFIPSSVKIGNEELENWLLRLLAPKIDFTFHEITVQNESIVLLEIDRAFRHPVRFRQQEFIRIGSYKKKLKDFPEKERALWRVFDETPFENQISYENMSDEAVLKVIDYQSYFDLFDIPVPESHKNILSALQDEQFLSPNDAGLWSITNLCVLLFAKKINDSSSTKRKAIRVITYTGPDKFDTIREQEGGKGYANGFEGLIKYINSQLPTNEVIEQALRKNVPMYPEIAIRELVANALIHQDLFVKGAGPIIEIFSDRIEITNPGKPLIDTNRFLDSPPRSRNEDLASFMRRIGVCEERGSGIDKVVHQTELYQLPPPLFEVSGDNTRVVLFAHKPFKEMDKEDRSWACYLHTCLRYVNRQDVTNSSVRERFGIEPQNSAVASRIIKDSVEAKLIMPYDPTVGRKYIKYVPFWAG